VLHDDGAAPFAELLSFAHELADASGRAILPHFRKAIRVDNKVEGGAFDPVTAADRDAERAIERLLAERWPDHGMVGEEFGARNLDARYRWVIDPIDGTRAFISGLPIWGTLIGVVEREEPRLGLMDQPFTRERFWSSARASHMRVGDGAALRLATRSCPGLNEAVLSTTHPSLFAPGVEADGFARLGSRVRMTRYGGDCYAYAMVAAGFIDLVVEAGLKPHDIAALIPIIERAGGRVTTWDGGPAVGGGRIIASGDPRLHEKAMAVLADRGICETPP